MNDSSCDLQVIQCARGGGNTRGGLRARGGNSNSDHVSVVSDIQSHESLKTGLTLNLISSPTAEQAVQIQEALSKIASSLGGLSNTTEAFKNDAASWGGRRSQITTVLAMCGVNVENQTAVFHFLKSHGFIGNNEIEVKTSNGKKKTVLPVLDKDGNVVQKTPKQVSSASGGSAAEEMSP